VAAGKVENVDVIADGGTIFGGIVCEAKLAGTALPESHGLTGRLTIAKYEQLFAIPRCNLAEKGKKVVRNALGILAHEAAGMRAAGVEVPKQRAVPLLIRLAGLLALASPRLDMVRDDLLNHDLGPAVRVGGTDRAVLWDGDHVGDSGGVAVDGSRRRKDNVCDIVPLHRAQQRDAAADVDAIVLEGNLARFANSLGTAPEGSADGLVQRQERLPALRAAK